MAECAINTGVESAFEIYLPKHEENRDFKHEQDVHLKQDRSNRGNKTGEKERHETDVRERGEIRSRTVGKLMVRGRMTKGITLSTVFIALRLGLSTPDSAPSYGKRERERNREEI